MFRCIFVLACVALTLGERASIKDYPYQLSVEGLGYHVCGAVLIGEKWALTAAHCLDVYTVDSITIRAGSEVFQEGGELLKIKSVHNHEQYSRTSLNYDLAIMELAEPLKFSENVSSIPLVESNVEFPENTTATVTGWGFLSLTHELGLSRWLQVTEVPIVSYEDCRSAYVALGGRITDNMICAGYLENGQDNCMGDTGGPLVIDGALAGIVSWSAECTEDGYPVVYASVSALRSFVKDVTGI